MLAVFPAPALDPALAGVAGEDGVTVLAAGVTVGDVDALFAEDAGTFSAEGTLLPLLSPPLFSADLTLRTFGVFAALTVFAFSA